MLNRLTAQTILGATVDVLPVNVRLLATVAGNADGVLLKIGEAVRLNSVEVAVR